MANMTGHYIVVLLLNIVAISEAHYYEDSRYVFKMGCNIGCKCTKTHMSCFGNYWDHMPTSGNHSDVLIRYANYTVLTKDFMEDLNAPKITRFRIMQSGISQIHRSTFYCFYRLQTLGLQGNKLKMIHANVLNPRHSTMLSVDLSGNLLKYVPEEFLCLLNRSNSLRINIGNNPYQVVQFTSNCFRKTRIILDLSNTASLDKITTSTFAGFRYSKVHGLSLDKCSISVIETGAFDFLRHLKKLDLSWNELKVLENGTLNSLDHLEKLNLQQNSIVFLDLQVLPNAHLWNLSIGAPELENTAQVFQSLGRLQNLRYLHIKNVTIETFSSETLTPLSTLPTLKFLYINFCNITQFVKNPFTVDLKLQGLHLNNNNLSGSAVEGLMKSQSLSRTLTHLDMSNNILYEINPEKKTTHTFGRLSHLGLDNAYVHEFPFRVLEKMLNLNTVRIGKNFIAIQPKKYDSTTFHSVRDVSLTRTCERMDFPVNLVCIFPNATKVDLSFKDLNFIKRAWFTCPSKAELPIRTLDLTGNTLTSVESLYNLRDLKEYSIAENKLYYLLDISFNNMTSLKVLNLSFNLISHLQQDTFLHQTKLERLYLSENQLERLNGKVFRNLKSIHHLTLSRNRLQHIHVSDIVNLHTLHSLDLRHNDLECSCRTLPLYEYLAKGKVHIYSIAESGQVKCSHGTSGERIDLIAFMVSDFECDHYGVVLLNVGMWCVCMVVVLALSLLYRWRWYIKYQYFIFQSKVNKQREKDLDSAFRFAAFVSFSKYDCEWVMDKLVPQIEEKHDLSLCLYNRNWFAGRSIIDYIVNSIDQSRRVLFIVSNHSATSPWCCDEMSLARYRLLSERRDALLLVILERIHPSNMSPLLRHLMTSRLYIEWPRSDERKQRVFWESLVKSLHGGEEWRQRDFGASV